MMAKKVEVHIDDEEVKSERLPKMSSGNLKSHKILDEDDDSEDNEDFNPFANGSDSDDEGI